MGGQFEDFYNDMGEAVNQTIHEQASIVNGQTFDIEYHDKIRNLVRSMEGIFGNIQYDLLLTLTQNIYDEIKLGTLNREVGSQTYFEHYNDLSQFYLYSGKYKQAFIDGFNSNTADSTTMAVSFTTGEELSTTIHQSMSLNDGELSGTINSSPLMNMNDLLADEELSGIVTSSADQQLLIKPTVTSSSNMNENTISTDQELSATATSSDELLLVTATSSSTMSVNTVFADEELLVTVNSSQSMKVDNLSTDEELSVTVNSPQNMTVDKLSTDEELLVTASSSSGMNVNNLSEEEEIVGMSQGSDFEENYADKKAELAVLEYIDQLLWKTYQNSSHYMQDLQDDGFVDKIYIEYQFPKMFVSVFSLIYTHMHNAVIDAAYHVDQTSNMAVITTEYMR